MNILELSEQEINRRKALEELRAMGINPYPAAAYPTDAFSVDIKDEFDDEATEPRQVCIAGRMMSRRVMGKASFMELQDSKGRIQVYVTRDDICPGEDKELYNTVFKRLLDLGDFVGVKGFVFRTQTGEISVHAQALTVLAKSIRPLPVVKQKDGVTYDSFDDPELRYRQRYVDLIVNAGVKETFIKRSQVFKSMREYFDKDGFMEVETPILQPIPGGASARPFITHHNTLDVDLYLRIATELNLKRLVIGGFDRVYEMGRVFRNEGMDVRHNPEFTTIEFYQAYADYTDMMDITEGIVVNAAKSVLGTPVINYQGVEIDLSKVKRISMNDAVKEATGKDFLSCKTVEEARKMADEIGVPYEPRHGIGGILNQAFEEKVEETLMQPTFITGHPTEISPLAKRNPEDPRITDRFEFFIYGRELANGFTELNDPIDQEGRFLDQLKQREAGDDEAHVMDRDYITAMEYGLPPTGGVGIGIDRLVMLLTDAPSIRDVLLFPTMKPLSE